MHFLSEIDVASLILNARESLLQQRLHHNILYSVCECLLLFADRTPHLKNHSLFASINPIKVSSCHAFHRVQNLALGLSALAICLAYLILFQRPNRLLLLPVLLYVEFNLGAFKLGGVDLFYALFPSFVAEELQKDSLHLFKVPPLEVLHRPSHYCFLLLLKQDLLFPNVEFFGGLVRVESQEHVANLTVALSPQIFLLGHNYILLPVSVNLEGLEEVVLFGQNVRHLVLPLFQSLLVRLMGVIRPPLYCPLLLEVVESVKNLMPDSLDSAAPLGVVAESVEDFAHFSHL